MELEYVVSINRGEDLAQIEAELTASTGAGPIPNRSVDIANARPMSNRQTHFMLTEEEANTLREDPRIFGVDRPTGEDPLISIQPSVVQTGDFTQTTSDTGSYVNWGLRRVNEATNVYGTGSTVTGGYNYILDGTGVDIVIQDSGIQAGHPEWEDADGNTRLVQHDWYSVSGVSGTMPSGFYTDYHGHGTHCAGIAAGKTYGWAKNAKIYAMKLAGLEGSSDPNGGMSFADCVDCLIGWHNAKTNGRPTIVNMSWGSGYTAVKATNGSNYFAANLSYRGTNQGPQTNGATVYRDYGLGPWIYSASLGTEYYRIGARVSSTDAGIQELIDAGIHVVIAAGNDYNKIDVPDGDDYNNTRTGRLWVSGSESSFDYTTPYHRGSSPYDDEAFIVGSVDSVDQGGLDRKSTFSASGPGTTIWAPGSNIMSASSQTNQIGGSAYYADSNYKQTNISGTSMAAPQVTGLAALHLQVSKNYTPAQLKAQLEGDAKSVLYDNATAETNIGYDVTNALYGSENRMLFNKFGVAQDGTAKNGLVVRNAAINLRK
jgi:subtilisin family serine protease